MPRRGDAGQGVDPVVRINAQGWPFDSVRHNFFSELKKGNRVMCPCCDKHAHYDGRHITDEMVQQLWFLSKQDRPVSSRALQPTGNGAWRLYALLRHWGFIVAPTSDNWSITDLGRQFLAGEVEAARKVFVYNDHKVDETTDHIDVVHALHSHTDLGDVFSTTAENLSA